MRKLQPEDEIFCLEFENKAMRSLLFANEAERWVQGFISKRVEDEHLTRYKLAGKYSQGKKVLEVAGGSGYGSLVLATEGNAASVWSADIDKDSVRYGALRYPHENITREVMDVADMKFNSEFDVAISFETIEHVKDADGFLQTLNRALKPGGLLIISTPIASETTTKPHNKFHVIEWSYSDFHKKLTPLFRIDQVFVQSLENKKSRLTQIMNRLSGKPEEAPDPTPVEWKGEIPPNIWRGYQIVVCRKI